MRRVLHQSWSAFRSFADRAILAQHMKNATSAGQSQRVMWKRDSFDSWESPSACVYCTCSESGPVDTAGESLGSGQGLNRAQVKTD